MCDANVIKIQCKLILYNHYAAKMSIQLKGVGHILKNKNISTIKKSPKVKIAKSFEKDNMDKWYKKYMFVCTSQLG